MTADVQFLRLEKKASSNILTVAAQHNLRTLGMAHGPHIDQRRSASNKVLRGAETVDEVVGLAQALMKAAGVKLAKNTVRMVEVLFSLPAGTTIDPHVFFEHAVQWAEHYFAVPVLSAVVHLDEGAPHCHVMLLPLVDGRMQGSDLVGGPAKMRGMHTNFHDQVATSYGLARKALERRLNAACRAHAADAAIAALQANPELLNDPDVVAVLRALVGAANPERLVEVVGIDMPKPARKPKRKAASTFAAQMTRPVKPDTASRNRVSDGGSPIGFAPPRPVPMPMPAAAPEKSKPYCSVGFALEPASPHVPDQQHADADDSSLRRVRDDDAGPGYWSESLGEWVPLPVKPSRKLTAVLPPRH